MAIQNEQFIKHRYLSQSCGATASEVAGENAVSHFDASTVAEADHPVSFVEVRFPCDSSCIDRSTWVLRFARPFDALCLS